LRIHSGRPYAQSYRSRGWGINTGVEQISGEDEKYLLTIPVLKKIFKHKKVVKYGKY